MKKTIAISMILAIVFMASVFRPGCRIIVDGTVLPGIYDPAAASRCAAMARRTAEEITRTAEEAPFRLIPVLCPKLDSTDEELLYHVLLESYDGVEKLYAVSANGKQVGLLENLWEVTALLKEYPEGSIQITHSYSHPDAADGLTYVRTALRELEGNVVDF